jgi:hypothetical protein
MFQRRIRTAHDAIRPNLPSELPRDQFMASERCVKLRSFDVGQTVLVRDYRQQHKQWALGQILRRLSNVMYEVRVGSLIWVRHVNQLRGTSCHPQNETNPQISLETLLEDFDKPPESGKPTLLKKATKCPRTGSPLRRSARKKRNVEPLQVNPRLQSYKHKLQGGGVSGAARPRLMSAQATRVRRPINRVPHVIGRHLEGRVRDW